MSRKVCFVYQWATYGGVERVFLNRAQAFESHGRDVEIEIYYGSDGGGLAAFNRTIREQNLEHRLRVTPQLDPDRYAAVFVIDSPDLIPQVRTDRTKLVMECHTSYPASRRYLANLPSEIEHVVVPSRTFAHLLHEEWPNLSPRIRLLRNCVSPAHQESVPNLPAWKQQPLLYFGRLDELKNPQGIIDLFLELDRRAPGRYFALVVGPEVPGYDMALRIDRAGLRGKIIQMPPLSFLKTSTLLAAWRDLGGIMISPSFGESFGLAAAESIAAGIPVLLSWLPEHSELLGGDARHLYEPLDVVSGADKVEAMLENYPEASERMRDSARAFSYEAFLSDWDELMLDLGVASVPDCALNEEVGT